MPISATNLNKAYLAYFGRPADAVGQAYFATLEQADVIKAFDASAESKAIYGGDTAAKINAIYKNLFNREAEPAGLTYWLSLVSSGRVTPAGAAFSILEGAQGTDKTAIDNKLAASEAFIKAMDTTTEIVNYSGLNAAASARAFLATVDASAASLTAAVAGAQAAVTSAISTTQGNDYGVSLQLTRNRDSTDATAQGANVIASTSGNDSYTGTVDPANSFNNTINNDDYIDGAQGNDTLTLALLGSNTSNARVKNIENLVLGTNVAAVTYDLNINAGGQQTTGYQTIAADRIITGEALTIQNVFKGSTDTALPKFIWDNASNTTVAGTVNYNYLSGQTTGTADTQAIDLRSVNAGVLNIASGIETFSVNSGSGINPVLNAPNTEANTLGVTTNLIGTGARADLASGTTLTKVVVAGGANFGAAAGIVATTGLTDRAVQTTNDNAADVAANDRGITATATAANLVSLANTVTTYDASAATGAQNVMFTAKASGVETNVTLIGGAGNDYVEFQVGNINATGGEGNDTFAFVNTGFNSTFTTADTIVGGAGTDTIQLGLNGVGSIDVQWTEFNSKTGVDVLDLRAKENKVELSDGFVAAAEVAGGMVVRTDKIVQTSAASVANPAGGSTVEDASVNTINLTKLASNRVITFEGGSGSDRLVLNEQSFTSNATLKGGDNVNNAGPGAAAVAGDYDTLTVIDNAVLSRGDLSKTSGFEGLILVKSDTTSNRQFSVELTEQFMLANTQATDNRTSTLIDDMVFQIGTVRAANSNALGAGDTVTIDITDLFSGGVYKASLAGRGVDIETLTASGATVNYTFNNAAATAGQIAAVTKADATGRTDVIDASPAVRGTALPLNVIGTSALTSTGFGIQAGVTTTGGDDVINVTTTGALFMAAGSLLEGGAGGVDTLNVANGANISASTMGAGATLIENLVFATAAGTAVTMTGAQHAGFTAITASAGADTITLTTAAGVTGAAGVETYNLAAGGAFTYGATTPLGVVVNGTGGNEAVTVAGFAPAGAANLALGLGVDVIVATTGANLSLINGGAATTAESLTLTGAVTMTAAQHVGFTGAFTAGGAADSVTIGTQATGVNALVLGLAQLPVEAYTLAAATNDTVTVTTAGTAGLAFGANTVAGSSISLSGGGNDVVTLVNAAHNAADAGNFVTLTNFGAALGANMDTIRVTLAGASTSGPLVAVNAGSNTAYTGATNSIIEIENGGVVNLLDVADTLSVETLIANAIGAVTTAGNYTIVVYGGAGNNDAGIYSATLTAADVATGIGGFAVELVGVVQGVGANALTGANFAI